MDASQDGALVPIDESNWRDAMTVRVADDQLPLVADHQPVALVVLAKAHVQPGERTWEPLAFVRDGRVVAVLALAHGEDVSEIRNFAVDHDHQRQGVGLATLRAVFARAEGRGSTAVDLTVNASNQPAQALYRRAGMRPTEDVRNGETVWRITLDPS